MATEVKRRRGTTVEHSTFTGAVAELTVDLTKDTVVVHDGATQGGFPLLREDFNNAVFTIPDARYLLETNNLSDLPNKSTARTNLGVAIGSDVQAYDAQLDTLSGLSAEQAADLLAITASEYTQLQNIDSTTISSTQWGYLGELNQSLTTTSDVSFNTVTADLTGDVTGDLTGAIHVQGKNDTGGTLTKGTPVYISGQSADGQQFTIAAADSDGSGTMPSIGILSADVNNNSQGDIVTHGKLIGIDTSGFTVGDELYISSSGTLVNTPPTGESNLLQKIAKVVRVHASSGQIYIMGAGRTNAVPNLDEGAVFIGNSSNQAVASTFSIVNEPSPSGGGSLAYSNGTFTFTPASVPSVTGYVQTISTSATSGLVSNEDGNGIVTMSLDVNALTAETTVASGDFLALSQSGNTKKVELSDIDLSLLDNSASGFTNNAGTITGVTAGAGLDGGGTSGTVTLTHSDTSSQSSVNNLGVSVIQDVTLDTYGHVTGLTSKNLVNEFVPDKPNLVVQSAAQGNGSLSYNQTNKQFEYTPPASAAGDITEIATSTTSGLSGGTTSGVATLSLNISRLVDMTEDVAAIDEIAILDGATNKKKPLGEIDISVFNNDAGFGAGDITGVTAGAGLSGGGTSGAVTLSHSDTSSQASVDNSNGSVIQDVTLDTYGHVTGLTSTDLDSRYLELSGGTISGILNIENGNSLRLYSPSDAYANADARNSGNGARIHRFNKNSTNTGYLPYYENWYDGSSYHSIGVENDVWQISDGLDVSGRTKVYSAIGASDNVRTGLAHYDTTAMAANVGGQLVLGYKYDTGGTYTEGAILKMYKENGTSGQYGSGLKFQVRNHGANLSTKMILDPSGNVGINTIPSSSYKLDVNGAGHFVNDLILDEDLVVADNIYLSDTNTALLEGGSNSVKIQTDSGYIELGPKNTSYSHIETDRDQFYFNKKLIVNSGVVSSYDEDLQLRRAGISADRITIKDASIDFDLNSTTEFQITTSEVIAKQTMRLESVNEDTNATTALLYSQAQTIVRRTLGSNAFNSDTIPTNNNQLTNGAGYTTNVGDITGVTAGNGLSGGGTSGAVTLAVDFSELPSNPPVAIDSTDQLIWYETVSGTENRTVISSFPLSAFDNDSSFINQTSGDARYLRSNADDTTTGNITIGKADPVLILNDTSASNSTVLTAFTSYRAQGSEKGFVGFGSGSNNYLYVRNSDGRIDIQGSTGIYLNSDTTLSGDLDVTGAIVLEDSQPIKWDTNNILSHNGTSTYLGDAASASTLTLSGGNGTFEGDLSITGGDLTLGTDSIASNINAVGDVLAFKVDSNENSGGTPNIQFKVGAATELTINGSSATFAGTVLIDGVSNYTGLTVKGSGASRPAVNFTNATQGNLGTIFGTEARAVSIATGAIGVIALTLDSSQNATIAGDLDVDGTDIVISNSLILGEDAYNASTNYVGMKTSFQTGTNDYMIISGKSDGNTYLSARAGSSLHLRGGGNDSGNEIIVYDSGIVNRIDIDTSTAYFNGNVGIGTISPSAKLDIKGDGADFFLQSNDFKIARIQPRGTGADLDKGLLSLFDGSTEDVRIDTQGSSWFNGGNLGIGTASPGRKLHLLNGQIKFENTSTGGWAGLDFAVGNGTYDGYMGMLDNDGRFFIDVNSNGEDFTILQNGNVGIGTTNPTFQLHVVGNSYIDADSNSANLTLGRYSGQPNIKAGGDDGGYLIMDSTGGDAALNWYVSDNVILANGGGNVGIGTDSPNYKLEVNGNAEFLDNVNIKSNSYDDYQIAVDSVGFSIYNRTDSAYNMTIDHTGNVGIGTIYPTSLGGGAKLSVNQAADGNIVFARGGSTRQVQIGTTSTTGYINADNTSGGLTFNVNTTERMRIDSSGTIKGIGAYTAGNSIKIFQAERSGSAVASDWSYDDATTDMSLGTSTAHSFSLKTGNTRALTIDSSQNATFASNVSMVNGNASSKFAVKSAGVHPSYDLYNDGTSYFNGGVIVDAGFTQSGGAVSSFSGDVEIAGDVEVDGNVGINDPTPSASLSIISNDANIIDLSRQNVGTYRLAISSTDKFSVFDVGANTDRLVIDSSGNVGIGTTSPTAHLHVNSTSTSQSTAYFYSNATKSAPSVQIWQDGAASTGQALLIRNDGTGNSLQIDDTTAGNAVFVVDSDGKVGIGTTSPSVKLDISQDDDTTNDLDVFNLKRVWSSATSTDRSHGIKFSDTNATLANIYADRTNSGANYNGDLVFVTNSGASGTNTSEKMRIDSTGNVNIYGTDNRPLAITSFATVSAGAGWDLNATSGNGVVTVSTGGTERMRIDSSSTTKITSDGQNVAGTILELHFPNNNTNDRCATINLTNNVGGYAAIEGGTSGANNSGYIAFKTDDAGTQSEKMRILPSGGITFNGDTATANALDDYEEGTFTPQIHAGASNTSFNSNNYGKYTKIGNVVHCSGRFSVTSITAGSSSTNVELGGLPFAANTPLGTSTGAVAGSIGFASGFAGEAPTMMQIRDGETNAFLYFQNSSLGISNLKGNDFGTGAHSIVFQITYHV